MSSDVDIVRQTGWKPAGSAGRAMEPPKDAAAGSLTGNAWLAAVKIPPQAHPVP